MHELRRSFVFALALAAGLFSIVPASAATDLPQKPILLVSQASPDSSMDLFCRVIAKVAMRT